MTGVLLAAAVARLAPPCAGAVAPVCSAAVCEDDTGPDLSDLDALPVEAIEELPVAVAVAPDALSMPRAVAAPADPLRVAPKTSPPAVVA